MARGKLFESWSFKLELPAPFDDPQYSGQKDHGLSMYNTAGAVCKASLHAPTLRALLAYATDPATEDYQPMHVNFGIMPPLETPIRNKGQRYAAYAARGAEALEGFLSDLREKALL